MQGLGLAKPHCSNFVYTGCYAHGGATPTARFAQRRSGPPEGGSPRRGFSAARGATRSYADGGATPTARFAHKRAGLSFGLSPRQRGCAARGPARTARFAQRRSGSPEGGGPRRGFSAARARAFPALDGDIPKAGFLSHGEGGGQRIMPRPGRSASVPRGGRQNRPGRAKAPTSRGGGGGRAEPARRGPLAPAMFGPLGRTPPPPAGDAGLQGFELSALLGILYPVA